MEQNRLSVLAKLSATLSSCRLACRIPVVWPFAAFLRIDDNLVHSVHYLRVSMRTRSSLRLLLVKKNTSLIIRISIMFRGEEKIFSHRELAL